MQEIRTYNYTDIVLGQEESFSVTVSEHMIESFRQNTGDINPLHCDDNFAADLGYPSHVAYGILTASFLSTLAGVYMPGQNCLLHEVQVKFIDPVFVGDVLTVKGVVTEKQDLFKRIVIKVTIIKQNGAKVLRGIVKAGVLK